MKFKALEWNTGEADELGICLISAASPAGYNHFLSIGAQDGMFYPLWDNAHPGSASLPEMQTMAQAFHEAKLKEMFSRWVEAD